MKPKPPRYFICEECNCETVPNPWPDTTIIEVVCVKCDVPHAIEWINEDGSEYYEH